MRQPVARENVLALLRSIAQSNGLRLREEAGIVRVEAAGAAEAQSPADSGAAAQQDQRLFVYRLRHAQAVRIAATLQAIFGGSGARSNSGTIQRGPLSRQLRDQRLPPFNPADTTRPTNPPAPAPPSTPAPPQGSLPGQLGGEVYIVPDEATNSLLVRAEPADWQIIQQAVGALDLRPLQVLIEVMIAEVRRSRDVEVGVSGKGLRTRQNGNRTSAELASASTADFILKLSRVGTVDIDVAILHHLIPYAGVRGDVRILSRPVVLAQNNQEAKILVGSQRPFVQVFRSLPTDAGVRDQVVQYRDVGTSLTILPTINPDDYVNLQVVQEVSTATNELQFGAPVISTREASTHLFVRDGQTAVLGGLIDRQQDKSRSGIPILSSIPLVGGAFATTRSSTSTSELFLFLTPHLVRTDQELDDTRRRIEREAPLLQDAGVVPIDTTAVRPKKP
jgi:general secretion pathway protein D